ncbi:MAG TPA: tRNA lysidine(34) synthetase TilS [Chthoniobacterales bacterium]|nr:tRNA lysidine(34) synthetase TilS [Chthoniobacterales bacterium]
MKTRSVSSGWPTEMLAGFAPTARYLIGVSGGRDSVALLHWLNQRGFKRLIVCHLDHKLRGRASRSDAAFVAALAEKYGYEAEIGSVEVRRLAAQNGTSVEMAGRVARYQFFAQVAARRRCRSVLLAHHADDLVETALLNFLRGTGTAGVASIRAVSSRREGRLELTLVRPLLGVWRREIDAYVRRHALKFREDETNSRLDATRNRLRHRVLPYLQRQLGRDVRRAIWRAAQIWSDEEALLDSMTDAAITRAATLRVETLRNMPIAIQRRTILGWLRSRGISDVGFDVVERVRELISPDARSAKTNLPRNFFVRRREKKLFIEHLKERRPTNR